MDLSEADTRALVTAMRDQVQTVALVNDVTLDIEELTQYDGQGRCSVLNVEGAGWRKSGGIGGHGDRLRRWAADKGWTLEDNVWGLVMKKMRVRADILEDIKDIKDDIIRTPHLRAHLLRILGAWLSCGFLLYFSWEI